MKVIISQQNKKLLITFKSGKLVDKYRIDKADDFLVTVDKSLRKRRIKSIGRIGQISLIGPMGLLTERIIRAIIVGLRF